MAHAVYRFRKESPRVAPASHGPRKQTYPRYVDRFECREGDWRIAERCLVVADQINEQMTTPAETETDDFLVPRRDDQDTYYRMREEAGLAKIV